MSLTDSPPQRRRQRPAFRGGGNPFCWQGWRLGLPNRWNPLKLEGDHASGYAGFADLLQQRLGMRWHTLGGRRFNPGDWAHKTMRQEVGVLAAEEAREVSPPVEGDWAISLLYSEPEPPGRDIWVGYSRSSGRGVVLAYHTRRRDRILAGSLVPHLIDLPTDRPMPWSVFELSCMVPAGFTLATHRLNAGDLSLTFARKRQMLTVRQLAVAQLALQRLPLDKWLAQQQNQHRKHYRPAGREALPLTLEAGDRTLTGMRRERRRRLRFFMMRSLAGVVHSFALHDAVRDRLVLVEASDEALARDVVQTLGWAQDSV